jgi:hypothetical protein
MLHSGARVREHAGPESMCPGPQFSTTYDFGLKEIGQQKLNFGEES